ncbi:Hypothetical predicted protein [Paramuricea clavata]|uniref:Uncharacterized protein n=1 Tax=Paramuricea clavata TaxID=317549 RepID=A0A7D9ICA5_PARCT|nr:Hypothetical predicted protein [Paramuricea clavata]
MLSLVVCCGLIFSFVSASSNNQSSNERIHISTALPAMSNFSSNASTGSKPCILEMKHSEISQIVEIFNNDLVHVVDISVSLSNVSHGKELLSDFHVQLMNPIGREIIFALDSNVLKFKTLPWTLTVGIRDFEMHVLESQNDCIRNRTNATEFALETVQNIVRTINLATNYDVWYSFKEISSGEERKNCCHVTKLNLLECNDGCSKSNSFLSQNTTFWEGLFLILILVVPLCLTSLIFNLASRSDFNVKYSKCYKLEESRMSSSFIFFKIIWQENGRLIACIRTCLLMFVLAGFWFLWTPNFLVIYVHAGIAVLHVTCCLLPVESTISYSMQKDRRIKFFFEFPGNILVWCGYDAAELREELESCETIVMIKMLTLLCNIKFWRKASKTVKQKIATFTAKHTKFNNRALKFLAVCLCYAFAVFIYFFLVFILPFYSILVVFLCLLYTRLLLVSSSSDLKSCCGCLLWYVFLILSLGLYLFWTIVLIPKATVSLLFGLFLNLIFFIPYLAFVSVLTFYCISYWKSMEENYLLLKQQIYEACRDAQDDDNVCIPNKRPKRNEKVLPVVSKALYDKIRDKLLPYDKNLFYLGVKMLCVFAFAFAIFQLIKMLREFEVTGFVQVLTTASLGVMPHIFNIATLKTSEQMKVAWKEKMKLNVKYMVEELVRDDSELAQTEVIIPWRDDTTNQTTGDNDHQVNKECVELPQTEVMIHQEQDTTNEMTDDNGQVNEERVEPPQTEVMIHQEHDTTNEMTDNNDPVNEECVELPQMEVMIHQEHDTTKEMTDNNDPVNEECVELPQTEVMIHQEHDTTNEMTDNNDPVNEECVELPQTEVMIHQEHDTTNEMTDDNGQVNEERVEPPQTEVMIHQEHDTTNEMTDDNDQVNEERVELPQTEVMIHQEHDTTNEMTDDNVQVNEERVEPSQTEVMIHQEHDTTNEMSDGNDEVNEDRVELPLTEVMIHQEHDTTNEMTDDNDQVNERVELLEMEVIIRQEHDTTNEVTNDNHGVLGRVFKIFRKRKRR